MSCSWVEKEGGSLWGGGLGGADVPACYDGGKNKKNLVPLFKKVKNKKFHQPRT